MKNLLPRFLVPLLLVCQTCTLRAVLFSSWTGAQPIYDNDASGVAFNFDVSGAPNSILDISVALDFSGGYNGDLYVYLSHGDGFAVLLNRVGRTTTSDDGYSTPGMQVTLTGSATADIHNYMALSPTYNGSGQLTGTWGADGRDVDPASALDTTDRTATLTAFDGLDPNGSWTLYFRDTSPLGQSMLNAWSVDIVAVPELPVDVALGALAVVPLLVWGRRAWQARRHGCRAGPCSCHED